MTPAEIIATKLLGWFRHQNGTAYTHGSSGRIFFPDDAMEYPEEWPDLSDWNDIRRIEDALAERRLLVPYFFELQTDECEWPEALRANAEQRVAAALKMIEEAGL
jgi:hypothetical protein